MGLPQFQGLSAFEAGEIRFLQFIKNKRLSSALTAELRGLLSQRAGTAFEDFLERSIFRRVAARAVRVSATSRHTADFDVNGVWIEAKTGAIDKVQLEKIAEGARQLGRQFWYVFLEKPSQSAIDKIKALGGTVGWFLE